jgi:tryptophan synthase alpha subunit
MSAIDALFRQLRSDGRKAFMPFVTAGDPDLDFTAEVIRRLAARGCSLVEVGIPYSDSVADGPVIQASYTRALEHKTKLADILAMLEGLTARNSPLPFGEGPGVRAACSGQSPAVSGQKKVGSRQSAVGSRAASSSLQSPVPNPSAGSPHPNPLPKGEGTGVEAAGQSFPPIVTMVSYSIVFRHGLERYVADARAAGVAGAIVPDLPLEEAGPLADVCRRADFSLIQLVTPTTPRDRARRIAERSTGFLYYVSVTGITGERTALPPEIGDNVAWLRQQTPLPVCIGFGISRPEHVRLLAPAADGLIVGSALVRRIAEVATKPRGQVLDEIGDYAAELLAAVQG